MAKKIKLVLEDEAKDAQQLTTGYPRWVPCPDCGRKFYADNAEYAEYLRQFGCVNCARARRRRKAQP